MSLIKTKYLSIIFSTILIAAIPMQNALAVAKDGFKDLPEAHANFQTVTRLQELGIIGGYPDGTFKPNKAVNRVEALKIVLLGSGVQIPEKTGSGGFKDTEKNEWYAKYLLKGLELNIVKGYADKTLQPNKTVNLVENLKMLLVANNVDLSKITVEKNPYNDAPKTEWYAKYLQYAKNNNLIDADDRGNIKPSQNMTRGKLSEMMYRLIKLKENGKSAASKENGKSTVSKSDQKEETSVVDPDVLKGTKEPTGPVGAGSGSGGGSSKPAEIFLGIKIEGFAFNIPSMTVGAGTTVKWMNKDSAAHTVTSDNGKFDSGNLANGQTWEYTFKEPGTYEYHCTPHPFMKATIIVKPANEVPTI